MTKKTRDMLNKLMKETGHDEDKLIQLMIKLWRLIGP